MPIPVLRAETYYVPAPARPGRPAEDWSQVPGAELAYRWINQRLHRNTPIPTAFAPDAQPVYARVDDNRWLAQCANCNSAVLVSLTDLRFGCTECRRGWVPLIVPDDVAAIEAQMMELPRRFWWNPDDPTNPNLPETQPEPEPEDPPAEPDPEEQP